MKSMIGRRKMTSVYLDPTKLEALQRLSDATNRPMAEHVREGVDLILEKYDVDVPLPKVTPARKKRVGKKRPTRKKP